MSCFGQRSSNVLAQVVRNMLEVLEASIAQQIRQMTRYLANIPIIPPTESKSEREKNIWTLSLHCLTSVLFLGKPQSVKDATSLKPVSLDHSLNASCSIG